MKRIFSLFILSFMFIPCVLAAVARDVRISDNDGHVLNINSDGTIPISGGGGGGWTDGGTNVYLTTSTDSVGIGTTLPIGRMTIKGQNTHYLGCSDSISSAVSAAASGDTIILGSCTYSVSSQIDITKALTIRGTPAKTIIDNGTNNILVFNVTSDNVTFDGLKFIGTRSNGAVTFDATASTVFNNCNIRNVVVEYTDATDGTGNTLLWYDAGGTLENFDLTITSKTGSSQTKGITHYHYNTAEADTTLRMRNGVVRLYEQDATSTGQLRAFFSWINSASISVGSVYNYLDNVNLFCKGLAYANDVECMQNQGPGVAYNPGVTGRVQSFVTGGYIDGGWGNDTDKCSSISCENYRIDDYAEAYFYGTMFGEGGRFTSVSNGAVYKLGGIAYLQGIIGDTPVQSPRTATAHPLISLVGQKGGWRHGTGTQTGLNGGLVSITTGAGGEAIEATTNGNGGNGGAISFISGAGSDQTTATPTTQNAGDGGLITIGAGAGGAAANGTNNNGGDGGSVLLYAGAGGSGSTSAGLNGTVYIGHTAVSTAHTGYTVLNMKTKTIAADDTTPDVRYSSMHITSANTGATAITDLDNPTVGDIVCLMGGSNTNSSTLGDSGVFNLTAAMTLGLDDVICLYVQADNDYIEIFRADN